ncbi:MAG: membrane dipeptidase [Anaerolineae bacterium]|nr:membrane dipeptidase [Anaerolineae bacterium]
MKIIDAHEDIAWNVLTFGRDILNSAQETRRQEEGTRIPSYNGSCMLGLPDWLAGGVALVWGSLFVAPARRSLGSWDSEAYADAEQAHRRFSAQLDVYHRLRDQSKQIELVGSQADLEAVWEPQEGAAPRVGILPLMEGADGIRRPAEVAEWHRRGVRAVGLTWATRSRYAGGNVEPGPLTDAGRELLAAMADVGMVLDVSHLAEEAFWEAVERYQGPVAASHANPRAIVPGPRQLSDGMIAALAERDGVIGIVPFNRFLSRGWAPTDGKETVTIQHVAAAIDHVCQVVGDAAHVGLGSDFDGGFGAESAPAGIDTVADLPKIAAALGERGYADAQVAAIMGENWLRLLRAALPAD